MLLQPHPLLWTAIENTRIIRFVYHGKDRIAEPHDHGILNGSVQLLSWQVAGRSTRRLPNWLLTKVNEMTDLVLLDQTFSGGRPTASGKHIKWDGCSSGSNPPPTRPTEPYADLPKAHKLLNFGRGIRS